MVSLKESVKEQDFVRYYIKERSMMMDEVEKWAEDYIKEHDRRMEQWFRIHSHQTAAEAIRESSRFLRGEKK